MAGHDNHGQTPAAWTGVVIVLIGFSLGGAFTIMAQPLGVLAGLGVVALGGVVGLAMRSMGLGAERPRPAARTAPAAGQRDARSVPAQESAAGRPAAGASTAAPEPQQAAAGG